MASIVTKGDITLQQKVQKVIEDLGQLEKYLDDANQILGNVEEIRDARRRRMNGLIDEGHLDPDVMVVWDWVQENHPDKVFGPMFFYVWPKTAVDQNYVENAFSDVLHYFVCEDEEIIVEMIDVLNKRSGLSFGLVGLMEKTANNENITADQRRMVKNLGFDRCIDDCFDSNPTVAKCLRKLYSTSLYFIGKDVNDKRALELMAFWKRSTNGQLRKKWRCITARSKYEDLDSDEGRVVYITPTKKPKLLTSSDEESKTQEMRHSELMMKIEKLKKHLTEFEPELDDIGGIENVVKRYKELVKNAEEIQTQTEKEIQASQEKLEMLQSKRKNLDDTVQPEIKEEFDEIKHKIQQVRNHNKERMATLLGDHILPHTEVLSTAGPRIFDAAVDMSTCLLDIAVWCRFFHECNAQKKNLPDVIVNRKKQNGDLDAAIKVTKEKLENFVKYAFLERSKNVAYVKQMMRKLNKTNTIADLTAGMKETLNGYAHMEKASITKLDDLKTSMHTDYDTCCLERSNLHFSLRKLEVSQTVILQTWKKKLEYCLKKMDTTMQQLLERMGYTGSIKFGQPDLNHSEDINDIDKYGIVLSVGFHEDSEPTTLTHHYQSGGEKGVAVALFLLALQKHSNVPFRIVDEINQGMDAWNEKMVFQLLLETAAKSKVQYISISPKGTPEFALDDPSSLNFCFLMRTLSNQCPSLYRMEKVLEGVENEEVQQNSDGSIAV